LESLRVPHAWFLGTHEEFRSKYRSPIENQHNEAVKERLAKMVRPFMLRRTKEAVATELPKKTEVIERIELAGLSETCTKACDWR